MNHGAIVSVTVGICAYNESENIEGAIRSVYSQTVAADKVIVVSSGSTDGTDDIVRKLTEEYETLILLSQEKREGKNSAINLMLDNAGTDIVVFLNADNVFANENALRELLLPFSDDHVGMVGGRPIPTNTPDSKIGFASVMLWTMHHHVALIQPKIGEIIAFRDIGTRLPTNQQSDEDILKMELEDRGYISVYAPLAVVRNRGPENLDDFMKQRIRVNIGEMYMKKMHRIDIPTWNIKPVIGAFLATVKEMGFRPYEITYAIVLETRARMIAKRHVRRDAGDHNVWERITSTKKL